MVGFTSLVPLVSFRTPPISVSTTLSETLQLPGPGAQRSLCAVSRIGSGTDTVPGAIDSGIMILDRSIVWFSGWLERDIRCVSERGVEGIAPSLEGPRSTLWGCDESDPERFSLCISGVGKRKPCCLRCRQQGSAPPM